MHRQPAYSTRPRAVLDCQGYHIEGGEEARDLGVDEAIGLSLRNDLLQQRLLHGQRASEG